MYLQPYPSQIATSLYAQRRQSPFSHSSVCVVLLYDFTLLSTEILLSHEHVVTGNVSSILKMVWMFGKRSLLDSFKAHVRVAGISEELFQKVYKVMNILRNICICISIIDIYYQLHLYSSYSIKIYSLSLGEVQMEMFLGGVSHL